MEIKKSAINKIRRFTKKMESDEIGGLLLGEVNGSNIEISDAMILKQTKTTASFEIDEKDMMDFTKNADDKTLGSIIGWWHSHGTGGTFWSGIDDNTSNRLCKMFSGLCVSLVVSNDKRENDRFRVDIERKNGEVVCIDNLEFEIVDSFLGLFDGDDEKLSKKEEKELEEKVTDEEVNYKYEEELAEETTENTTFDKDVKDFETEIEKIAG